MLKWVEIARENASERFKILSHFLTQNHIENELNFIETTDLGLYDELEEAKKKFDQIRIGIPFGKLAYTFYEKVKASGGFVRH